MDLLVIWTILAPLGLGVNGSILADTVVHGLELRRRNRNGVNCAVTISHVVPESVFVFFQVFLTFFSWRAWSYYGWDRSEGYIIENIAGGTVLAATLLLLGIFSIYWRRKISGLVRDEEVKLERSEARNERASE